MRIIDDDREDLGGHEVRRLDVLPGELAVGNALEIRRKKLYRKLYRTFERCVRERWRMIVRHAYRQITCPSASLIS
jgi:hypothetical protein